VEVAISRMSNQETIMNVALWIVQALLAVVFASSGVAKSAMSKQALLASGQTGVRDYSVPFIRFIASLEILGALGLLLPGLTEVAPFLTPLAAIGLAIIMVGAARAHSRLAREDGGRRRKELLNVATNAVLFAACAFVVAGRAAWM
jgi:uncharacterized membrane protein YphA (DoxX/SURF4 family)